MTNQKQFTGKKSTKIKLKAKQYEKKITKQQRVKRGKKLDKRVEKKERKNKAKFYRFIEM